jgi:hypothetical protein
LTSIVLKPGTEHVLPTNQHQRRSLASVTVATGDLLITLDTAAKVSLLGQTVDNPGRRTSSY